MRALVESPCAPPCWQNIIPGKTSKQEVMELIPQIPDIDQHKSKWIGPWNIYTDIFRILFQDKRSKGDIRFLDDTVVSIFLYDDLNIDVDQVIDLYGQPESVIIEKEYSGDIIHLSISLIYPDEGIFLNFTDGDLNTAHIQPDKKIEWVVFVDPLRFETTLTEGASIIDPEAFQNNRYPWVGYTNIEFED